MFETVTNKDQLNVCLFWRVKVRATSLFRAICFEITTFSFGLPLRNDNTSPCPERTSKEKWGKPFQISLCIEEELSQCFADSDPRQTRHIEFDKIFYQEKKVDNQCDSFGLWIINIDSSKAKTT